MELHMMNMIMWHFPCTHKQKRLHFHAKTTSAKLYIYIGVGQGNCSLTKHTQRWAYSWYFSLHVAYSALLHFLWHWEPFGNHSKDMYHSYVASAALKRYFEKIPQSLTSTKVVRRQYKTIWDACMFATLSDKTTQDHDTIKDHERLYIIIHDHIITNH